MARKKHIAPAAGVPVLPPEPANDQAGAVYTIPDLARRWRVTRHTIMVAIRAERLKAFRVGKREWRVLEKDAFAFEEQQQGQAVAS